MTHERIPRPSATVANPAPTLLSRPAVASDTSSGLSTVAILRPRYDFTAIPLHAPKVGTTAAAGGVIQLQRRRKLNPKQEAQRQRLLARRERRAQPQRDRERFQARVAAATTGFQEAVGSQTFHPSNAFPFDVFDRSKEAPVAEVLKRLPAEQRRSADFRRTLAAGDAAHGAGQARTQVNALGLQETLAAHQFAAERSLDPASIKPHSPSIDFEARGTGRCCSTPSARPGRVPTNSRVNVSSGNGRQRTVVRAEAPMATIRTGKAAT